MKLFCQKGFTAIEGILTITIMGLLAYAVMPALDNIPTMDLQGAVDKVKADIRYAQSLATTTSEAHGFRVIADNIYEIYDVGTDAAVNSPYTNSAMTESLATSFGATQFGANNYQIEFDAQGTPTMGGGVPIVISNTGTNRSITVSASSGFISSD